MTTVSRDLPCSPEDVFAVLGNGWLNGSWEMGTARIRGVDPTWPTPGSQLHHSTGLWPVVINDVTTVLESEPPHRLVLRAQVRPIGIFAVTIRVTQTYVGCRVDITATVAGGALGLLPAALTAIPLRVRNTESLRRLAIIVQGRNRSRPARRP